MSREIEFMIRDLKNAIDVLKEEPADKVSKIYFIETLDIFCQRLEDILKENK